MSAAKPAPKGRKALTTTIKLVLGLGILFLVLNKLSLDDRVELEDGTVWVGRELSLEEARLAVEEREGGERHVFALDEGQPRLERGRGGPDDWTWVREGGEAVPIEPPERLGTVHLRPSAGEGPSERPLSRVAWTVVREIEDGEGRVVREEVELALREGLWTIFGRLDPLTYGLALLAILGMYLSGIRRWQLLMRGQGLEVGFREAFRLTFIGNFFNNVVPGMTGGDVIKAVMIARAHPGRGPVAVSTVIVDRVLGLLVLALISAIAVLFALDTFSMVAPYILGVLGVGLGGALMFMSRRIRRFLRIDRLLTRLPGAQTLRRLDEAFLAYRRCPWTIFHAVWLSFLAHGFNLVSVILMGLDLGVGPRNGLVEPAWLTYLATVPIILIVSSVPLLPGGWGVGEFAYGFFFRAVGITNLSLSVGLSVLTRATLLFFSLLGGVLLFARRKETMAAVHEAEEAD